MPRQFHRLLLITATALISSNAFAEDPANTRHELMEGVRDAAKVVGGMLQGKVDFDQDAAMESLRTFEAAGDQLGGLFPEGSEGGEAAPAIWEDREGFEAEISKWQAATAAAIEAAPETLDAAKPVLGRVMKSCKGCHDSYRIEDE